MIDDDQMLDVLFLVCLGSLIIGRAVGFTPGTFIHEDELASDAMGFAKAALKEYKQTSGDLNLKQEN